MSNHVAWEKTSTNKETQTNTEYKTEISTVKYKYYKISIQCFKDKAKHYGPCIES